LANQVSYAFTAANQMMAFRQLLRPDTAFQWNDELENAFQESKKVITKEIEEGIAIFDTNRPTCLVTDWSRSGIGFWLLQKHCSCKNLEPFAAKLEGEQPWSEVASHSPTRKTTHLLWEKLWQS